MKKSFFFIAILSNLICIPAHAEIYKCQEKTGEIIFMDGASKHQDAQCKLIFKEAQSTKSNTHANAKKSALATPDFPSVDSKTQQKRDDKRKQILLNEFTLEQNALAKAKTENQHAEILAHQKNIELLTKEINALK
jgi:hypothetical protein